MHSPCRCQQMSSPWPCHPRCQVHPDCGCQAQAHRSRYQTYCPQCQASRTWWSGHTITGARLAVPGARLALPNGASHGCQDCRTWWFQTHHHGCQACRPRCQAYGPCRCQQTYRPWPWMTVQPAPCLVPEGRGSPASCACVRIQTGCTSPRAGCR